MSRRTILFVRDAAGGSVTEHWRRFFFEAFGHLRLPAGNSFAPGRAARLRDEQAKKLEQLRALENGISITVVRVNYDSMGVDVAEDVGGVERFLETK